MLALDSIRAHKLRSFLTLLGIIIGVASVILVGAAIDGLGAYTERITSKAFGTDSFIVAQVASVGDMTERQYVQKLHYNKPVRPQDVKYLREATGDEMEYSQYQQRTDDVRSGSQIFESAIVIGVSYTLPDMRDVPVANGRFFSETEERLRTPVTVIGADISANLFPAVSPLGKTIRVGGQELTVIGVIEHQGSSFGNSMDTPVYLPATVYNAIYGGQRGMAVFARGRSESGVSFNGATELVRAALRSHFHTRPGKPDNFDILTPDSIRGFVNQILSVIAGVVVPITGISLVVGGIVVMNIMLVSVTERTREIGIRKSLGARRTDIMLQFLTESVILSLVGGCLGVALGALLSFVIAKLFSLTLAITAPYVMLSVFVSSAVGIISGWYPASRAARLDPVVALRAE
jgi:putative ABC transport system permease protein